MGSRAAAWRGEPRFAAWPPAGYRLALVCQPSVCPPAASLPRRPLVAVAESIVDVVPAASRFLSSGSAISPLLLQLKAVCDAIAGCSLLGGALQEVPATVAFKIGAACSLVFGPGTALLERLLASLQAGAAAASLSATLLSICGAQLSMFYRGCTTCEKAATVRRRMQAQPEQGGVKAEMVLTPANAAAPSSTWCRPASLGWRRAHCRRLAAALAPLGPHMPDVLVEALCTLRLLACGLHAAGVGKGAAASSR